MNPIQFEEAVGRFFQQQGFTVEFTSRSYDYGVDVIATNGNEKIAVQAKMYEQRQVNYQDVMYLFAGKAFYDCDSAVLITNGQISRDAERVAEKLGVRTTYGWSPSELDEEQFSYELVTNSVEVEISKELFGKVWMQYVMPLKGKTVPTTTGRENLILDVTWDWLKRQSSTGAVSKLEFSIFRLCYSHIMENGQMTREEINHLYTSRGSAIIFAVLSTIPYFDLERNRRATLVLNREKLLRAATV